MYTGPVQQNEHPVTVTPPDDHPPPQKPDHTKAAVGVTLAGFVMLAFVLEGGWAALAIAPALLALEKIVATILRPER